MLKSFFALLVFMPLLIMFPASAQASIPSQKDTHTPPALSSSAEVYLVTAGPGTRIWERFGHNALWFYDRKNKIDIVYHWGVFSFQSDQFWPCFILNSMRFAMERTTPRDFLAGKSVTRQSVWIQNLALSTNQMQSLFSLCYQNDSEQSRYYDYDYFHDNCSTRIRDLLDQVLDGAIKQSAATNYTGHTRHWHCRRFIQYFPAAYLGIQCILGTPADKPVSAWDEMFLPLSLQEHLRSVINPNSDLEYMPLVWSEMLIAEGTVPVPPDPYSYFPPFIMLSLGSSFLIIAMAFHQNKAWCRWLLAASVCAWSLTAGLMGSLLLFAVLCTSHVYWYWNENLFQLSPLSLTLIFPAVCLIRYRSDPSWTFYLAGSIAGLSLLGFFLKLLPSFCQDNIEIIAITLPIHCTLAFVFYHRSTSVFRIQGSGTE